MIERRTHPRHRTYLGATLEFNGGCSTFDCVIRNASRTGLCVNLGDTTITPGASILHVTKSGRRLPVQVAWRCQSTSGLVFAAGSGELV